MSITVEQIINRARQQLNEDAQRDRALDHSGTATGGSVTTIETDNASLNVNDDYYNRGNFVIRMTSGTAANDGVVRNIIGYDYDGGGSTITVSPAFSSAVVNTDGYVVYKYNRTNDPDLLEIINMAHDYITEEISQKYENLLLITVQFDVVADQFLYTLSDIATDIMSVRWLKHLSSYPDTDNNWELYANRFKAVIADRFNDPDSRGPVYTIEGVNLKVSPPTESATDGFKLGYIPRMAQLTSFDSAPFVTSGGVDFDAVIGRYDGLIVDYVVAFYKGKMPEFKQYVKERLTNVEDFVADKQRRFRMPE